MIPATRADGFTSASVLGDAVLERARALHATALHQLRVRTDRWFVVLMLVQWLAGIVAVLLLSPSTWAGAYRSLHMDVPAAIFLGAAIAAFPIAMVFMCPGAASTRHVVAVGQMLASALIVHLSGGRVEASFHVFVSLAILAFYQDGRVLITAGAVVLADHLLRGAFWPESVYGVARATPWRAVEHFAWITFENTVLLVSIRARLRDMYTGAVNQAGLETNHAAVEQLVQDRTRSLEASERAFRTLADSSPVGVFESDPLGHCRYANKRWQQLTGLTYQELTSGEGMGAVHPEDRAALAAARDATASEDRAFHHSFRIVRATGECLWVSARAAALRDTTGRITGYVGTVEDISQQKQTEAQLILSRDRALEAARLKSEFLGNMSHEIRTPLNGILGMTELLSDSALTDEQRDYLNVVRSSGEALYKVASDILDFSSIETGKLRLKPSPFSLHNTVAEACRSLRGHAQEKQLELTCETAADLPPGVLGDADCLRKVLLNLIGNAIKFTAAGSVRVGVCYRGGIGGLGLSASSHSETEMHQIEFSVTDTGIGIPAEKQGLIFEAFTQADGSTTRRFGGTGLGLAISSQLVSAMGGRIHVESEPGRGSTFRFTLPFELAEVVTERAARPSSTLTRTISTADTTAVASATAAAGTASATAASSTTRNGPTPLAQIPTAGATGPLAPVADGSQRTLRVLLAEDTPVNSLLATAILKSRGHEVTSVENGRDALVRLNDGTYDLVLMDVQMPIMNGLEAAAAIRLGEAGSGRHVAIIALTAHAMAGDRERCLAAGMDGYVSKPFKPAQVLAEIERVMALGDAQGSEDRAA